MAALDDLETVLQVACLTEDRSPVEQRALLRVAVKIEAARNASTTQALTARWGQPPCTIVDEVEATYQPPEEGRPAALTTADRQRVDRRRAGWLKAHDEARRHHGPDWAPPS